MILRAARERRGLSQEALAEEADIHRNYVGMVERGETAVTLDVAALVANALGVGLDQLVREASKEHERSGRPKEVRRGRVPRPKKKSRRT